MASKAHIEQELVRPNSKVQVINLFILFFAKHATSYQFVYAVYLDLFHRVNTLVFLSFFVMLDDWQ
jgi:hypothetical protein